MTNPNLHIIDDGTMDTVVACAGCDWEGRYNPEEIVGREPSDNSEYAMEIQRVADALEIAGEDHDCGVPDDGPLPDVYELARLYPWEPAQ